MKTFYFTLLLLVPLFLMLAGCGKDIKTRLVGKWVIDDDPEILTMEFYKDGRVLSTYKEGVTLEGTWKIQPDDKIEISIELWKITAYFTGNKLILRSNEKEKVYRKSK